MAENVRVIVRCRPQNEKEKTLGCKCVVKMKDCTVETWDPLEGPSFPKQFTFDSVYDQESNTENIYNDICYPLIESVLEGYNSTIFVYGQTGCGKSYTMEGDKSGGMTADKGIIPRAFEHVFEAISVTTGVKYLALVSYLEIYNEQIRDLLVTDKNNAHASLSLKESPNEGLTVPGLTMVPVHDISECEQLLSTGSKNRMIGATLMNQASSRSHSIFTISIEQMSNVNNNESVRKGKLNLVDLAGSERQTKTGATGERLKEATKINLSLSALGNVISALVDGKARHIPYRDSKLTRLLQDSLGGNTRTLMIACVSPSSRDYVETLSTLRYANRAKNIHNKPRVNEDPKDTMLRKYQEEIERLRSLLEDKQSAPANPTEEANATLNAKRDHLIQEYQSEMEKMKNLHANEKSEKENVLRQIDAIRREYQANIEQLNEQVRDKHEQQSKSKEDILSRIEELKAAMIGGEKANDQELSERRRRKKQAAERRASAIAHVLAKIEMNEDREMLQNQYKDISQELDLKTDALRRYRHKVKLLEKEIADIQGEFESEREDYLETIRKQERTMRLLTQICEKIAVTLKKDCNYSDLDAIKEQAVWLDDAQKYRLPELVVRRTKLPPAAGRTSDIQTAPGRLESDTESLDGDGDRGYRNRLSSSQSEGSVNSAPETPGHDSRLQKGEEEDIIGSYFKPKRAMQLLNQSKIEPSKVINTWRGVLDNIPDYARRNKPSSQPTENMTTGTTLNAIKSPNNGFCWTNGNMAADQRRPFRLEALPTLEKRRKERVEFL